VIWESAQRSCPYRYSRFQWSSSFQHLHGSEYGNGWQLHQQTRETSSVSRLNLNIENWIFLISFHCFFSKKFQPLNISFIFRSFNFLLPQTSVIWNSTVHGKRWNPLARAISSCYFINCRKHLLEKFSACLWKQQKFPQMFLKLFHQATLCCYSFWETDFCLCYRYLAVCCTF